MNAKLSSRIKGKPDGPSSSSEARLVATSPQEELEVTALPSLYALRTGSGRPSVLTIRVGRSSRWAFALLAMSISALSVADLKIVSTMRRESRGVSSSPQTITTYVKGGLVRTESGGMVSIADASQKRLIAIDAKGKTYSIVPLGPPKGTVPAREGLKATASGKVTPTPDRRKVAGLSARRFVATARVRQSIPTMSPGSAEVLIEMEQWVSESVALPESSRRLAGAFGLAFGMRAVDPAFKALSAEFAKIKGLPLASRVTLKPISRGGVMSSARPLTVVTEVRSVSHPKLSDALFRVPAGYKKIERAVAANLKKAHDHASDSPSPRR
jgi:hypothetical protein